MQGYIVLALGQKRYYDMAHNAALSAKRMDPNRPVALIHDNSQDLDDYRSVFDEFVEMPTDPEFVGVANKLRLIEFGPFDENMFIDADCLFVKPDMDRHWDRFSGHGFNMAAQIQSRGTWYNFDVADVCKRLELPHICRMNSGVFYFDKGLLARRIAADALYYYRNHADVLAVVHQGRERQFSDEPFFGAAMAKSRISPIQYTREEGSIMVTSWGATRYEADLRSGSVIVEKPKSMHPLRRLLPFSKVQHSPSILHFIGLKPQKVYDRLTNELRSEAGLPALTL